MEGKSFIKVKANSMESAKWVIFNNGYEIIDFVIADSSEDEINRIIESLQEKEKPIREFKEEDIKDQIYIPLDIRKIIKRKLQKKELYIQIEDDFFFDSLIEKKILIPKMGIFEIDDIRLEKIIKFIKNKES